MKQLELPFNEKCKHQPSKKITLEKINDDCWKALSYCEKCNNIIKLNLLYPIVGFYPSESRLIIDYYVGNWSLEYGA